MKTFAWTLIAIRYILMTISPICYVQSVFIVFDPDVICWYAHCNVGIVCVWERKRGTERDHGCVCVTVCVCVCVHAHMHTQTHALVQGCMCVCPFPKVTRTEFVWFWNAVTLHDCLYHFLDCPNLFWPWNPCLLFSVFYSTGVQVVWHMQRSAHWLWANVSMETFCLGSSSGMLRQVHVHSFWLPYQSMILWQEKNERVSSLGCFVVVVVVTVLFYVFLRFIDSAKCFSGFHVVRKKCSGLCMPIYLHPCRVKATLPAGISESACECVHQNGWFTFAMSFKSRMYLNILW